jgi:hypothetical protein
MALMTYVLGNSLVNIFEKEKLSTDEDIPKVAADILKIIVTG